MTLDSLADNSLKSNQLEVWAGLIILFDSLDSISLLLEWA